MVTVVRIEDGPSGYRSLVELVKDKGVKRSPRGKATRDLGLTVIEIENPYRAYPTGSGRLLNRRIVAAEAIQLIGAYSDPGLLPSGFDAYKDPDGRFWGAYGDRIGYQMMDVVRKLQVDHSTRQAIISLWNSRLDNVFGHADYPCTLSIGFSVNEVGHLDMDVMMRSSDVWLGIPYDFGQFSALQMTVAALLNRDVGVYRHTTLSLHLYETDVTKTNTLLEWPGEMHDDAFPKGLARPDDNAYDVIKRCRTIPYVNEYFTDNEHWYREALVHS